MEPVRIKYYGILWITRRTYVIIQTMVFAVLAAALVFVLTLPTSPRFGLDLEDPRLPALTRWLLGHLLEIVLLTTLLEILDAVFTLRAFARKEQEARASLPKTNPLGNPPTPQP
jgi:hypothetical protein